MDKGLQVKELARIIGVTPETIINWELRGAKPEEESVDKIKEFLKKE